MESSPAQIVLDSNSTPAVLEQPILASRREPEPLGVPTLQFSRKDLEFRFNADGMVDVALRVTNPGPGVSPPRRGRIEVAAFGAFLPWEPLTVFRVPRLRPRQSTLVELRVRRTPAAGGLPPEPPREPKSALPLVARAPGTIWDLLKSAMTAFGGLERCAPGAPIFAGNLNVHIGTASVERHLSGALRVYPGRINVAVFEVGRRGDAYRFEVRSSDPSWEASLHHFYGRAGELESEIMSGEWYDRNGGLAVILAVKPPDECRRGAIEVHVEQRSSGRIAVVEFDLDQKALGAGCYTV